MALGAGETTLLKMTTAYSEFVNGGRKITPTLIDRIQDRQGHTIYRHDNRPCPHCTAPSDGQKATALPDLRPELTDPVQAYQDFPLPDGVEQRGPRAPPRHRGIERN